MIDQEANYRSRLRRTGLRRRNDAIGQAIAAIVAITRREWMAQGLGAGRAG